MEIDVKMEIVKKRAFVEIGEGDAPAQFGFVVVRHFRDLQGNDIGFPTPAEITATAEEFAEFFDHGSVHMTTVINEQAQRIAQQNEAAVETAALLVSARSAAETAEQKIVDKDREIEEKQSVIDAANGEIVRLRVLVDGLSAQHVTDEQQISSLQAVVASAAQAAGGV